MRTSRRILYGLSLALASLGCWLLTSGGDSGLATICFTMPTALLMTPSEATRRMPTRMPVPILCGLVASVALIVLLRRIVPDPTAERFLRHLATALCMWILMLSVFCLKWRRERPCAGA